MSAAVAFFLLSRASPAERPTPAADPWAPVRFLIGQWTGQSEGEPGKGTVTTARAGRAQQNDEEAGAAPVPRASIDARRGGRRGARAGDTPWTCGG